MCFTSRFPGPKRKPVEQWCQVEVSRFAILPGTNGNNAEYVLAVTSSDINADVASRWDCQNYYGSDKWFAGHRNGASGLSNPYTTDISNYKTAVQWIQSQIDSNSKYKTDDTRFWVNVPAI